MKITREHTLAELTKVLGEPVVKLSGSALPELLKMAVVEMFLADKKFEHADCSYICSILLNGLRTTGELTFDD
jgi:hypothetical protein